MHGPAQLCAGIYAVRLRHINEKEGKVCRNILRHDLYPLDMSALGPGVCNIHCRADV